MQLPTSKFDLWTFKSYPLRKLKEESSYSGLFNFELDLFPPTLHYYHFIFPLKNKREDKQDKLEKRELSSFRCYLCLFLLLLFCFPVIRFLYWRLWNYQAESERVKEGDRKSHGFCFLCQQGCLSSCFQLCYFELLHNSGFRGSTLARWRRYDLKFNIFTIFGSFDFLGLVFFALFRFCLNKLVFGTQRPWKEKRFFVWSSIDLNVSVCSEFIAYFGLFSFKCLSFCFVIIYEHDCSVWLPRIWGKRTENFVI